MVNPLGGQWSDLNREEYNQLDKTEQMNYHLSMNVVYYIQVKGATEPRAAGQAPPATDKTIRELRELTRFHARQGSRIKYGSDKESFYSLKDENNRKTCVPIYDAVYKREPTTKEMYDNYSRDEKMAYWPRQASNTLDKKYAKLAYLMIGRMKQDKNYDPPYEGDTSPHGVYLDRQNRDVKEYDNFSSDEKRKYHKRMAGRLEPDKRPKWSSKEKLDRVKHGTEERRFHTRMYHRIKRNTGKPTYPTIEAEEDD
jgi:hypothetical protein